MPDNTASNGVRFFEFEVFKHHTEIVNGVFTRRGGVSHAPFDSLNTSFSTGDDPESVSRNRQRIVQTLDAQSVPVYINQVHGDRTVEVDAGSWDNPFGPPAADGMVTAHPKRLLVIQVADCQSVMLYDPVKRVAANVHAGWRGSIRNIVGKCIEHMASRFGTRPKDLLAGVGPSLGPCCAEFVNFENEIPPRLHGYRTEKEGVFFDFRKMSADHMVQKGVKAANIELMDFCTKCRPDLFYSYRRDKVTGRFASAIGILN
ncbi:MAG: peptidoglycan editing factor PgeF [Desulfarculaceae bacterium]|nr:peptidoglycan editing factor PgeF [Desulfarculaceae bacterium]